MYFFNLIVNKINFAYVFNTECMYQSLESENEKKNLIYWQILGITKIYLRKKFERWKVHSGLCRNNN